MKDETKVLIEPYGHEVQSSKIERVWVKRRKKHSITRRRTTSFDEISGLFYSPMEYLFKPIIRESMEKIDIEYVSHMLINFVKGEFGTGSKVESSPDLPIVMEERWDNHEFLHTYLKCCEQELVYTDYIQTISDKSGNSFSENIEIILTHPLIGHKSNTKNVNWEEIASFFSKEEKNEQRLMFVLPSFPFKDRNYFRTNQASSEEPDLSELALLIRLHSLSIAIYQVHPFGADWVIASDGTLYSDIFGVTQKSAEVYLQKLLHWRNRLNLNGTVTILDLKEMIDHVIEAYGHKSYEDDYQAVVQIIDMLSEKGDEDFREAYKVLVRGMRQNLSNHHLVKSFGSERAWHIVMSEEVNNLSISEKAAKEEFEIQAKNAAKFYAARNLLLRRYNVITKIWPQSLRSTVHPKHGQIAVPTLGTCFPWNGVAFVENPAEVSPNCVYVCRFYELARQYPKLIAHRSIESGAILFYSPSS